MNVYCCLARDCMPWIANNLYKVMAFKNPEDKIIVVENNSKDGTKEFLKDLTYSHNKKSLLDSYSDDDPDNEIILIGKDNNVPRYGQKPLKERADYLADVRNSYLDYIKEHFDKTIDRMILFDSDLWDLGTQNWHTLFTEHAATCANGLIHIQVGNMNHMIYYDSWAYLHLTEDFVHGVKNPIPLMQPPGLVEVRSAFGGAAAYHWDAVRDCRYSFFDLHKMHKNGRPMCLGEHGGLNEDIRKKGGRVFIQTECILYNMRFPL